MQTKLRQAGTRTNIQKTSIQTGQREGHTYRQAELQPGRHTHRHTYTEAGRQAGRQANRKNSNSDRPAQPDQTRPKQTKPKRQTHRKTD